MPSSLRCGRPSDVCSLDFGEGTAVWIGERARIKIHLRGDEAIDDLVDAQLAAEGGDDWKVIGLANVDVFGKVSKWSLHGRQQSRH